MAGQFGHDLLYRSAGKWMNKVELEKCTVLTNALLSSQHKLRLAPQEEQLISNRLFMCSLRKWEFSMRFSDKLFIWEIFFFSFYFRTSSRYLLSEFLPGLFIPKCRLFSVKELGLKQGSMGFHLQGSLSGPQLLPFFKLIPPAQLNLYSVHINIWNIKPSLCKTVTLFFFYHCQTSNTARFSTMKRLHALYAIFMSHCKLFIGL